LLLCLLLSTACQRLVLGEDEANTPENNFSLFWKDFDQHYSLFEVRGWNWDSIRRAYEPLVSPQTTDEELFSIFSEMIAYLDDSHTFILWPGRDIFVSGAGAIDRVRAEFNYELIKEQYVDVIAESPENDLRYGRFRGRDIGYLHFPGIDLDDQDYIDVVIRDLRERKAIIIDLRNNVGGEDRDAIAIGGRFQAEERFVYTVQERNGPQHGDFAEKITFFSRPLGKESFLKPIVVLTDEGTASAGEILILHLQSAPEMTQIGTATAGDFSDTGMRRFLPNGMEYRYSIMKFLLPDGTSLDGVGLVPDIEVRNSTEDLAAGRDAVLERAFRFLFEEYGIE
ncbi:MAG: S41 family peptidase, partial [Bacteroidota bacterium]